MVFGFEEYVEPVTKSPSDFPEDFLQSMRSSTDPLADAVFEALRMEQPDQHFAPSLDLVECIRERGLKEIEEGNVEGLFARFWLSISTLPPWYDHKRVENGKNLLISCGLPAAFSLTACSLVSSYGAARGSQVLTQTGRLNDDVVKRIFETGKFMYSIFTTNSMIPGECGWKSVIQVRLLHCAVRSYLVSRPSVHWDEETLGKPINQEDLAGTLCLFGPLLIESMNKLNYVLPTKLRDDYFLLWRTVGFYIGIDDRVLAKNYAQSLDLMNAVKQHQWGPSEGSLKLVESLFRSLHLRPRYFFLPSSFWHALSRFLLGDQHADALGLQKSFFWGKVVLLFRLMVFCISLLHRYVPFTRSLNAQFNWMYWTFFNRILQRGRTVDFKMKRY